MSPSDSLAKAQLTLLNVADLAERFQVGQSKVRQLVRDEGLPHLWLGRHLRFHPEAVARWLVSRVEVTPTLGASQQPVIPAFDWSQAQAS
jgi:excisionase family DNA binding protein